MAKETAKDGEETKKAPARRTATKRASTKKEPLLSETEEQELSQPASAKRKSAKKEEEKETGGKTVKRKKADEEAEQEENLESKAPPKRRSVRKKADESSSAKGSSEKGMMPEQLAESVSEKGMTSEQEHEEVRFSKPSGRSVNIRAEPAKVQKSSSKRREESIRPKRKASEWDSDYADLRNRRSAKRNPGKTAGRKSFVRPKRRKHSKAGKGIFLASLLLSMISVGALFLQNVDLQVYAEDVGQALASTVGLDTTPPVINAAVSDGYLQIIAEDKESSIDKIFVCGYEYSGLVNGALSIRLQQFDAGYEQFSIYAVDAAGNISQEYLVLNPYYAAPDGSNAGAADALPVDAGPAGASSATGTVMEHSTTSSTGPGSSGSGASSGSGSTGGSGSGTGRSGSTGASGSGTGEGSNAGNSRSGSGSNDGSGSASRSEAKQQALEEADEWEDGDIPENYSYDAQSGSGEGAGKEFYTIKTGNDKTFYLVIDRDKNDENVHFLTDISERDLLNTTQDNSSTLPRNSAVASGQGALFESALPGGNGLASFWEDKAEEKGETEEVEEDSLEEKPEESAETSEAPGFSLPGGPLIRIVVIVALAAIAVFVILKIKKGRRKESDEDEDEEDNEAYEEYEEDSGEEDPEGDEAYEEREEEDEEGGEDDDEA